MPVAVAPTQVAAEAEAAAVVGNRPAEAVASNPNLRASDASGASHGGRPNPLLQAQRWR
jgi:hypothetical protein